MTDEREVGRRRMQDAGVPTASSDAGARGGPRITARGVAFAILVGGGVYGVGAMAGGFAIGASGLDLPELPDGAWAEGAVLLLFLAGLGMAAAFAALSAGLTGTRGQRWATLATFAIVVEGIGNAMEGATYTTLDGQWTALLVRVPAAALCAWVVVRLVPGRMGGRWGDRWRRFVTASRGATRVGRIALAWLAFPVVYFTFGLLVLPFVRSYYEKLEFLTIPPVGTVMTVLFARSALLLLASVPILVAWGGSRGGLIAALGLGHFVTVGFTGLVQSTFLPAPMVGFHGAEILADSFVYAALLVLLLVPRAARDAREGSLEAGAKSRPSTDNARSLGGNRKEKGMTGRNVAKLTFAILALTVALIVIHAIGIQLLPAAADGAAAAPSGSFLAIVLTVMLLQTAALAYPIVRSRWRGWRLAVAVFLLYYGTVTFLSQIESVVYLDGRLGDGMVRGLFLAWLFHAAVFAPVAVLVLGRWREGVPGGVQDARPGETSRRSWVRKSAFGGAVFVALYYLFGYYVAWKQPAVREFYGGTDPGSFLAQMRSVVSATPWMLPFQFVRGVVWTLLGLLVVRMMKGPWWEAGVATALLFAVPSLYLLFPNPLMPDAVRMAHLAETAPYQFLFGWFVAWLFGRTGQVAVQTAPVGADRASLSAG